MRDFSKSQKNKINGQELYRGKGGGLWREKREILPKVQKKRRKKRKEKENLLQKDSNNGRILIELRVEELWNFRKRFDF